MPYRTITVVIAVAIALVTHGGAGAQTPPTDPTDLGTPPSHHQSMLVRAFRAMIDSPTRRVFQRNLEGQSTLLEAGDGLFHQAGITVVGQDTNRSLTDRSSLLTFAYDIGGAWKPGARHGKHRQGLSWWIRGGCPISAPKDADLGQAIGALTEINGDLESDAFYFNDLYWGQALGETVSLMLGRIDTSFRFDFNAVANDPREQFLASSLVNSSVIPFPVAGTTAEVYWEIDDALDLHGAVSQANCERTSVCVDDLSGDELFFPVEVLYTPGLRWTLGNDRPILP